MEYEFLPFALPDIGEEEIDEVVDSLRSGWITTGPKTKKFEQDFADYIAEDVAAIAVNSATAGLHLALEALGVGVDDEVITTPYTFTATAEVVRYLGAHPVFVDIDPATFNIDVSKIEEAITAKTKVIIPVHFAGLPCDMDKILDVAKRHGLKVLEDSAHALPAKYKGKMVGSLQSDATVYSFYATKTMATGEGGMIVTKNKSVAQRVKVMRLHGISKDAFDRYNSKKPAWYYEVIAPGYKYNMTDITASMGIHQLKKLESFREKRHRLASYYDKELKNLPVILPPHAPVGDLHAWHLYVVRLKDDIKISRNDFIQMMADKNIGCSVHFIPLHIQPYWAETYSLQPDDYPNALYTFNHAVSLPLYTKMTESDAYRVVKAIKEILN